MDRLNALHALNLFSTKDESNEILKAKNAAFKIREKSKSENAEARRKDLEKLYMLAFQCNMLQSDEQLTKSFINVISEEDFTLSLAEEFVERDLLRTYDTESLY